MNKDEFINYLSKDGISLSEMQLNLFEKYYELIISYNKHTNITSITEKEDVYLKHFYDSIIITKYIDITNKKIIDIGSGAGFPGIVLAILDPSTQVVLLDSNNKKTTFLALVKKELSLENITIINARAEEYAKNNSEQFDICISRSVAYIDIIISLSIPFIKKDGVVVLMKGNIDNEIKVLQKYQKELNISNYSIHNYYLIGNTNERNVIIIKKSINNKLLLNYPQLLQRNKKWIKIIDNK